MIPYRSFPVPRIIKRRWLERRWIVWLLCVATAGSLACHRSAKPDPSDAPASGSELRVRDFYPLSVGNRWTYDVRMGNRTERKSIEIVAEEQGFHRDSEGGLLRIDDEGLRDPQRYLLRDPLVKGTAWSSVPAPGSIESYEIVEAGTSCRTPAGTFARCVRVRGENRVAASRLLVSEWTYAEGVGLVELRTRIERGEDEFLPQIEMVLVSFERGD